METEETFNLTISISSSPNVAQQFLLGRCSYFLLPPLQPVFEDLHTHIVQSRANIDSRSHRLLLESLLIVRFVTLVTSSSLTCDKSVDACYRLKSGTQGLQSASRICHTCLGGGGRQVEASQYSNVRANT